MTEVLNYFFLAFIPLFVAIDPPGVLPMFTHLTLGMSPTEKRTLVTHATLTALIISLIFLFAGRLLFMFLGITENDFRVAGGLLLLIIAIKDLSFSNYKKREPETHVGIVPIGIPLMIGPAALTTILMSVDNYGIMVTVLALLSNLLIVWLMFRHSDFLTRLVGDAGARAFAKVMALFLAAIAVMMIRVGISGFFEIGT